MNLSRLRNLCAHSPSAFDPTPPLSPSAEFLFHFTINGICSSGGPGPEEISSTESHFISLFYFPPVLRGHIFSRKCGRLYQAFYWNHLHGEGPAYSLNTIPQRVYVLSASPTNLPLEGEPAPIRNSLKDLDFLFSSLFCREIMLNMRLLWKLS